MKKPSSQSPDSTGVPAPPRHRWAWRAPIVLKNTRGARATRAPAMHATLRACQQLSHCCRCGDRKAFTTQKVIEQRALEVLPARHPVQPQARANRIDISA